MSNLRQAEVDLLLDMASEHPDPFSMLITLELLAYEPKTKRTGTLNNTQIEDALRGSGLTSRELMKRMVDRGFLGMDQSLHEVRSILTAALTGVYPKSQVTKRSLSPKPMRSYL